MQNVFHTVDFEINSCSLFKWKENTAKVGKHNIIFHVDLKLLEIFFLCIIHLAYYYFIGALNDAQNTDTNGGNEWNIWGLQCVNDWSCYRSHPHSCFSLFFCFFLSLALLAKIEAVENFRFIPFFWFAAIYYKTFHKGMTIIEPAMDIIMDGNASSQLTKYFFPLQNCRRLFVGGHFFAFSWKIAPEKCVTCAFALSSQCWR